MLWDVKCPYAFHSFLRIHLGAIAKKITAVEKLQVGRGARSYVGASHCFPNPLRGEPTPTPTTSLSLFLSTKTLQRGIQ